MRTLRSVRCLVRFAAALLSTALVLLVARPAEAALVTFYGADNGAGPTDARPSADAAAAAFDAAVLSFSVIDFETGTLAAPAPGVTLALTGAAGGGLVSTDQHSEVLGYNTTSGGTNWLQMWPAFNSAGGESATFSFASSITAFGGYFTDTQVGFPGSITVVFNDGSLQTLPVTKNDDTGGVLFFGFTSTLPFSQVVLNTGATGGTRDIWGLDDIRFNSTAAVPEPTTLLLLGSGLGAAAIRRRFGRK